MKDIELAVQNSALWAAYGDILGFMTELADADGVVWRTGVSKIFKPLPWKRLIGGHYGTNVTLLNGCYSDDTQLRLSTSRAIYSNGKFDVEAFAKVELPVWLSYSLGAGRGTKAAAASLRQQGVNWFSNFFDKDGPSYFSCGGNGAAMRVQPHVWASKDRSDPATYLVDVVKNSICTHGHARGILGAVFHAMCLAKTLTSKRVAGPEEWQEILTYMPKVVDLIMEDNELSNFWAPVWEERSKTKLADAFSAVCQECADDISRALEFSNDRSESGYERLVLSVDGLSDVSRGSGTKTAIIASVLSWMYRDGSPDDAMFVAANLLGSDTDTIATMAGALLGAVSSAPPSGEILDKDYIVADASRLVQISKGAKCDDYSYPDLMTWNPPKTQLDSLGLVGDEYFVSGLGRAKTLNESFRGRTKNTAWEWIRLEIGQTILVKRRDGLKKLSGRSLPMGKMTDESFKTKRLLPDRNVVENHNVNTAQAELFKDEPRGIHELTSEAIRSNFNPQIIGTHILEILEREQGIEHVIGYVSIIGKAKIARAEALKKNS